MIKMSSRIIIELKFINSKIWLELFDFVTGMGKFW
jgi:hypothetical protein